tara:strand:- start:320 stop:1624 length:1305 start_codon:yes stop_codon:yes gene_type:complete
MKFFEFIRGEVNESSVKASDSGIGLAVIVIPVENLAFITATKGSVSLTFNNTSLYEQTSLLPGEAVEKTNIQVSCIPGKEIELIDDITKFITSKTITQVMKFDAANQSSTFNKAIVKGIDDVIAKVSINPTVMASGEISKGDPQKIFTDVIGEIYFGDNKPSLDFNHEGLAKYGSNAEITAWDNAGTLGSVHSIVANVGNPSATTGLSASRGLSRTNASIALDDYFVVPNAYTVNGEYTIYMCIVPGGSEDALSVLYGDDSGDTMGFCFGDVVYNSSSGIAKTKGNLSTLKVRHDGRLGGPASVSTDNKEGGSVPYKFPEHYYDTVEGETCHVFVLRRDKNFNMFLHNRTGELVGFIPGFDISQTINGKLTSLDGMTDGSLLIEQIGSGGGIIETSGLSKSFSGFMPRFGVIEKDIGTNAAATLAEDLFNLYNF